VSQEYTSTWLQTQNIVQISTSYSKNIDLLLLDSDGKVYADEEPIS
jgi:hypothetical protein